MAGRASLRVRGGYDHQFVEEPPNGLKCDICHAVARQPQQHGECGRLFCMSCLTQHKQFTAKCPNCDLQLMTFFDGKSDQEIRSLEIRCSNSADGCQWTGPLGSLDQHLRGCDFAHVPCPNGCVQNKMTLHVCQKDLEHHLTNECPKRQYTCPHCYEPGVFVERTTVHLEFCPKVRVQCPHPDCEVSVPRSELDQHKLECDYELATCKFAPFGCNVTLSKRNMRAHEEDSNLHLQCTKEKVLELAKQVDEQEKRFNAQLKQQTKEIEFIKQSVKTCKKYVTPIYFKMNNFSEYKREDKTLYSPSFYSSQDGYRFQLGVSPNGNGQGRNTHISVFAYLEKGDNDDNLSWPFRGSVVVELINQLEDRNHLQFMINFPADEDASGRVASDQERSSGWGKKRLIAHSQLIHIPRKKTQYLRNDTLFFKIDTHVPDSRPWLECTI